MNIIIPLGGKGERFAKCGYTEPKPLIDILGKPMILHVLDNLFFLGSITKQDSIFIIYYNVDSQVFENIVQSKYPTIHFIQLQEQTKGASETIYKGISKIQELTQNKKTMILDCDTFYTQDVVSMFRNIDTNAVFYVDNTDTNPIFSYIQFDNLGKITQIAEKIKISDNANTGIYCFDNIDILFQYSKNVVLNNITMKNECYTSCIIDQMIQDKHLFTGIHLDSMCVFNLGTPEQLNEYINNAHVFLFDLDGTLVDSDNIYMDVWNQILIEYNIHLTKEIFKQYISGNSDLTVIQYLLPNIKIDIDAVSKKKDELFMQKLDKIQIIQGAVEIVYTIRKYGYPCAIVTNCNRIVAESILHYLNIYQLFDFIVIGSECSRPKPYSDPYQSAIQKFKISNKKAILFEDSKSGLLSAAGVTPKCIVGIETSYSSADLIKYSANITIPNFHLFDIMQVIHYSNSNTQILKQHIKQSLHMDILDIQIMETKLKGGFISDVLNVIITLTDNIALNCILKLENKNETFLTQMSNDLDLYNREYYFYESISKYVPVHIPRFYGLIKDNEFNNIGILMENIASDEYILNLNLNTESIDTSLKVINDLASMHSKFWNKNLMVHFRELKKHDNPMFSPKWSQFINLKWPVFKQKWKTILTETQLNIGEYIVANFIDIQNNLSDTNLTLIHGDVKSANIFYKKLQKGQYDPYFIDWQYIANGKGVQDLVFFMIESFDVNKMKTVKLLFKEYYYIKLVENGITNYSREVYNVDFINASYYFPFFVAIWFGTISEDELIDKNFPLFFIQKLFNYYVI